MKITVAPEMLTNLLSGVELGLIGRHELDGSWSEMEECQDFNTFLEGVQLPATLAVNVNSVAMECEFKVVSCYDSDPEHCPCCAWDSITIRKIA